ncbi:DUF3106 domain-containing protein [Ramlibacter sp. AW1]|uniref:DUF3106 domain-containing protein n=1 Tax=Ramlibacter aurantiacus TaxID=2801330 RepID=A0A936ZSY1_9BURK|nr:DUF3106 domain-containing protein [Ramlibacter aurantiacus]MBL0420555.1 DUF3106 domain-containing protein [Ramlibacter aurantiacus]
MPFRPSLVKLVLVATLGAGWVAVHATATAPATAPAIGAAPAKVARPASQPAWAELDATQRRALAPLAASWPRLSVSQKRKWLALAGNFEALSPEERSKLHSRMTEWAALTPQQRAHARLNFGEAQQVSPDERKSKWEAYQSLSAEEKRRLANDAKRRPPATAAPVRPVSPDKLAVVPRPDAHDTRAVRIEAPGRAAENPPLIPE